jgi:hypothetical protein
LPASQTIFVALTPTNARRGDTTQRGRDWASLELSLSLSLSLSLYIYIYITDKKKNKKERKKKRVYHEK